MKTELEVTYQEIISSGNLLLAWQEFVVGKRAKKDVIEFSLNLADNILQLHGDLANHNYRHGPYKDFFVTDPKLRHIHKAAVSDRLVHHALYRQLYPYFAKKFIAHSYSCQLDKGTHRAIIAFSQVAAKVSHNDRRTAWVLQADIRKFFASIDHKVLLEIMSKYILDKNIIRLLKNIIDSFGHDDGRGLPLGNLTSQLLVNIYMNEFDKFIKYKLKIKYYLRYADDFVFLAPDKDYLSVLLPLIKTFLNKNLKLQLHPQKIHLKTWASGVDWLGWINFPKNRVLRTKTKRRMMKKIKHQARPESLASYLGLLKHGNSFDLQKELLNNYWLYSEN